MSVDDDQVKDQLGTYCEKLGLHVNNATTVWYIRLRVCASKIRPEVEISLCGNVSQPRVAEMRIGHVVCLSSGIPVIAHTACRYGHYRAYIASKSDSSVQLGTARVLRMIVPRRPYLGMSSRSLTLTNDDLVRLFFPRRC